MDILELRNKCLENSTGKSRRPRTRKIIPGHIPRPMNSFLSYRTEKQSVIRKYCPTANHRDISKIVAKWWRALTETEKEAFREIAQDAKSEHTKKYPGYKFTPKKRKQKS
ncbi:high mobility group box domain-containing protein, partial [Pilobolus umbonatus]